ncbi:ATP synthase F1 subunit epsilon [Eubacterium oxidoreducens]|uniref:ATP synthase epsilon chain n=1 Tax=Eubacterium oxidoreducens TaxID=1732 RepID=A0A1G6CIH8_EUBOX|nr:ATP synthase F1 subunit epsilon [Eubacterium oxidoreducens]SDB32575.1 F-type H+-transporting ATPase subunit epsilon [Eubacterium oxidoreducens]
MENFDLKVIAANKIFFDGDAVSLVLPAIDGQIEILAHHEPYIIAVDPGEVVVKDSDMENHVGVCGRGFAKIGMDNHVELIVDTLEKPEEIDIRRAQEAFDRAKEQLRQKQSQQQYFQSKAAMARAMSRIREAHKYKR